MSGRIVKIFLPRQRWMDDGIAREALYALRNIGERTRRPVAVSHFENDPHDVEVELADPGGSVGSGMAQWLDEEKVRAIPAMTEDGFDAELTASVVLGTLATQLGEWGGEMTDPRERDAAGEGVFAPGEILSLDDPYIGGRAFREAVLLKVLERMEVPSRFNAEAFGAGYEQAFVGDALGITEQICRGFEQHQAEWTGEQAEADGDTEHDLGPKKPGAAGGAYL